MSRFGERLDLPIDGDSMALCPYTGDRYQIEKGLCKLIGKE